MMREQLLPPNVWGVILVLVVLTLAAAHAPAAITASGQAPVDRLVMGLILPYRDYGRPWLPVGTADHNIQHDPAFEWLLEVDIESGHYKPWLAESWQMAPDGRSWRITLRKGVQFHHGYGEFTAKDVVHTHALWCDDHYHGREDLPESDYWVSICQVKRVAVVNDYEIIKPKREDSVRLKALHTGQVQFINTRAQADIERFKETQGDKYHLWEWHSGGQFVVFNWRNGPFQDKRLRLAAAGMPTRIKGTSSVT